jgi:hypothetical protein
MDRHTCVSLNEAKEHRHNVFLSACLSCPLNVVQDKIFAHCVLATKKGKHSHIVAKISELARGETLCIASEGIPGFLRNS